MSAAVGASDVLVVGGALLGFALVSRRLAGTAVTPPMVAESRLRAAVPLTGTPMM